VFVGLNKIFKWAPYWFILSTFIGFGLPGIIAASAQVLAVVLGLESFKWLAMALLIIIGLVLSLGKTVYGVMERITKTIIFIGLPIIFILALTLADGTDWLKLSEGIIGLGEGYQFLPMGIVIGTFFGAFAYSGAGGNLNLTQSIYIKEKGYGMGKYAQKITGLFRNKEAKKIRLSGEEFELSEQNINRFKVWWKRINLEHFLVFWLLGFVAMCLLMILAYTTTFGLESNAEGINFVINEGLAIGRALWPVIGTLFLFLVAVMLFQTQLGVLDSTSRVMSENFAIEKSDYTGEVEVNLSKLYHIFLWSQIAFGISLFLFNIYEPKSLIVLGAVINAFAMFIHIG
ncbi:MAG: hypothetical protein COU22_01750, partial [Candidatus Komeilibacteria bacterium CG10_big_fil_rev_8_21_14_0_10_41_13]